MENPSENEIIEENKERVIDISVGEQHRKNVNRVME